jgi:hypothetical protein
MMLSNIKVDKSAIENMPSDAIIANQKIEDTSISSDIPSFDMPIVKTGMNPIIKYSLLGVGGALVIYLGYRFIFKR